MNQQTTEQMIIIPSYQDYINRYFPEHEESLFHPQSTPEETGAQMARDTLRQIKQALQIQLIAQSSVVAQSTTQ